MTKGTISLEDIRQYVENNIGTFHVARLDSLRILELKSILKRKNPYLFKAKNIFLAGDLVKLVLDAHLSSQEETMFGDFLEKMAIFICGKVFGGFKSDRASVDLEFEKDGIFHIVSIKSGPNWGNADQITKMRENFAKALNDIQSTRPDIQIVAVNGCCYGQDPNPNKGDYFKYCGQDFWEFISEIKELYTEIIEPLGYKAKEKNDDFQKQYAAILTNFTVEFANDFCENGNIDWKKLLAFNSGHLDPSRQLRERRKKY